MANCKPGDLAILIRDECLENIGAIVKVLRPWVPGDGGRVLPGPQWHCVADGRPLKAMRWMQWTSEDPPVQVGYAMSKPGEEVIVPDADLRPITGLPDADDTQREMDKPLEVSRG